MTVASKISEFDSLAARRVAGAPHVVSSWNGLTGDVKGTLAEIFSFGEGNAPLTDNIWTMPNGVRRFRSTPAGGSFTLVNDGFFEDPSLPADGRSAAWLTRRTQAPGQQSSTFEANTILNAGYVGNLIDGTEWLAHKGLLTADQSTVGQVGDVYWQQVYYGASFFGNAPLSIPDPGLAGGTVAYLFDDLYAHGNATIGTRQARQLSGWGQEIVYPLAQRNGITPGYVAVWTDRDIPVVAAGDGTGLWFSYGDASHEDPSRVRGAFEAHMMTADPFGNWGLGLWTRDSAIGPYQLVGFDADVGMQMFRGGVQLPNVDTTTAPVGGALAAKIVWDDTLQKVRISVDGGAYVDLSVFA